MLRSRYFVLVTVAAAALGLGGCGGGDDDDGPAAPTTYTVGGNVTGLSGSVVLRLNGGNNLTVNASGAFTFATPVNTGTAYTVTVFTQPANQTCTVTNGTGTGTANVTNVAVACATTTFTIGGTLSGLNGTVVLQNNGGNNLSLTANGNFTFTTAVNSGAAYAVTVLTQPNGQNCVATNASGNAAANVTNVTVTCTNIPATVTIGGTVAGLTAGTLVLQNNLGDNIQVTTSPFTFSSAIPGNSAYFVTVLVHPQGLTCTVTGNGSGIAIANVTDVQVTCVDNTVATITIGGNVSGLAGAGPLTLRNTYNALLGGGPATQDIQLTANGAFTFPAIPRRSVSTVTVLTQPPGQTCTASANTSNPISDYAGVVIECVNGTTVRTVGGTVSGLTGNLILTINVNNTALFVPSGATQFTFPNGLVAGTEFTVSIAVQPAGQTCVVTRDTEEIGGANITNVAVACVANVTSPLLGTYEVLGEDAYLTLYPDGTYLMATRENDVTCGTNNGNGIELGVYNYDATTGDFEVVSAAIDTNGDCGLWDGTGTSGAVQKAGIGQGSTITFNDGSDTFTLESVESVANTFIGSFRVVPSPDFLILHSNGRYTLTHSGNDPSGIEYGCYTLTGTTSGNFTPDVTPGTCTGFVDTNGDAGFTDADGQALPYTTISPYVIEAFERVIVRIVPN